MSKSFEFFNRTVKINRSINNHFLVKIDFYSWFLINFFKEYRLSLLKYSLSLFNCFINLLNSLIAKYKINRSINNNLSIFRHIRIQRYLSFYFFSKILSYSSETTKNCIYCLIRGKSQKKFLNEIRNAFWELDEIRNAFWELDFLSNWKRVWTGLPQNYGQLHYKGCYAKIFWIFWKWVKFGFY